MRQEEISLNTKLKLAESLKNAMKKKPFSKITVSELIRDCNINRNTFYYHFEDIYSLLRWIFERETLQMLRHFDMPNDHIAAISFVMDYIEENEYMVHCVLDIISREEMKHFMETELNNIILSIIEAIEKDVGKYLSEDYRHFISGFYTEALISMVIEWVKNRSTQNREKVIAYLSSTIRVSLLAIVNQDGPDTHIITKTTLSS